MFVPGRIPGGLDFGAARISVIIDHLTSIARPASLKPQVEHDVRLNPGLFMHSGQAHRETMLSI